MQPGVDPTYGRNGRTSGDNELVKVALGVGGLWLGEQHVHDVQSRAAERGEGVPVTLVRGQRRREDRERRKISRNLEMHGEVLSFVSNN